MAALQFGHSSRIDIEPDNGRAGLRESGCYGQAHIAKPDDRYFA
jgi:hypothetical protein